MIKLSEKQKEIAFSNEDKIVVLAASGSGKTALLTERVRYLLKSGVDPSEIVVITFTNAAAETLKKRLGNDYQYGLQISTIHSYANLLLLSAGVNTGHLIEEDKFDELFELLAKNPQCIRPVAHLLLDEAQDSSASQLNFVLDMIKPESFFFIGDVRQAIYSFNGARPDLIEKISRQRDVKTYSLDQNYRSGPRIISFAHRLITQTGLEDMSFSERDFSGIVQEIEFNTNRINKEIKESHDQYKDWFVLTRTNQEVWKMMDSLKKAGIPAETFKKAQLTTGEINDRIEANTVKVLTIHTAKGLEANNVVVVGPRYYNAEELRVCYVAATRAKNRLIWTRTPSYLKKKKRY